jgi:hypothetical protein
MRVVAEGLQQLSQGASYASVGSWAAGHKAPRQREVEPVKRRSVHYLQTGATWTEVYSPVLWDARQADLVPLDAAAEASPLPRVLVVDDVPLFGDVEDEEGDASAGSFRPDDAAIVFNGGINGQTVGNDDEGSSSPLIACPTRSGCMIPTA